MGSSTATSPMSAGGKTYSEVSELSRANPDDEELAGQVNTLFKGETLRGLLLYAWGMVRCEHDCALCRYRRTARIPDHAPRDAGRLPRRPEDRGAPHREIVGSSEPKHRAASDDLDAVEHATCVVGVAGDGGHRTTRLSA